jgi:hypothetical protein
MSGPYGEMEYEMARLCDELILVTTKARAALTQKAIAHLERRDIERSKMKLVVNRFT